jgi:hypothetical protein
MKIEAIGGGVGRVAARALVLAGADYRGPGINDPCADGATVVAEVQAW